MRQDYDQFKAKGAEVLAISPGDPTEAGRYFARQQLPFVGLADPDRAVFEAYGVFSKLLSLGQRPALFVVDRDGFVRYAHLATQQWQIPANQVVLERIDRLNGPGAGSSR